MGDRATVDRLWADLAGYHCFGCSPRNPHGLALQIATESEGVVSCALQLGQTYESYRGLIHGGIALVALDEVMGNAVVLLHHRLCFTVSFRSKFIAPLRTAHRYRVEARIAEVPSDEHPFYKVNGQILDAQDNAMVTANASYQVITVQQAKAHLGLTEAELGQLGTYFQPSDAPSSR